MNKLLKKLIPMILCTSLIIPLGVHASAESNSRATTEQKKIVTYFPSWGTYQKGQQNIEVKDIPWDKVTHINHGFFEISKDYKIQTTDAWADYGIQFGHHPAADWEKYPDTGYSPKNPAGHFAEYKYYKSQYPNVKLLVSVGGWTRSDMFHEIAKDANKRNILAQSMVDFLKTYPYFDGVDIDWEYPGITRAPEDEYDRGCVGGPEDKENFTLLLRDIRAKFDSNGMTNKLLTVAVSAGEAKINLTEPDKYHQYVDYIGVMTYDFAGGWDSITGHLASLYSNPNDPSADRKNFDTNYAMKLFESKGVPTNKLLAGTPLYSRGWGGVEPGPNGDGLFQPGNGNFTGELGAGGQYSYYDIVKLEQSAQWKKFRDPIAGVPYLYNSSAKQFLTYEDPQSLLERVSYVNENKYGGLIVWDASGDIFNGYPMHTLMYDNMIKNQTIIPHEYEKEDVNKDRVINITDLAEVASKYNILRGQTSYNEVYDVNRDGVIDVYDLVLVGKKLASSDEKPVDPTDPEVPKDTWDPNVAYTGGQTVVYKGVTYKAKWWTQGDTPGVADVWQKVS